MDLLERYVQAVGRYLSPAAREDTLAELRANLLEQMDARSEELGHPLTEPMHPQSCKRTDVLR